MNKHRIGAGVGALFSLLLGMAPAAMAQAPLRVSIKFILNASGNRPATGGLNTDEEINTELDEGNGILEENMTEFQLDVIEFVDLSGLSAYYSYGSNATDRDNLRTAAMNDPTTFHWRTDAVNIYINGGTGSAISRFPPDNDIILMNQNCGNTPSCILHELGHTMNLMHTHESCCTNQDECTDTIADNDAWTKDQVSQNNFGATYNNLSASQKRQVDLVWNNIMSYHTNEPQRLLTPCQMNRVSTQNYADRNTHLGKIPVYVNSGYSGATSNGAFTTPYKTLQDALNAGGLTNRVMVLQGGGYSMTGEYLGGSFEMVTRSGQSSIVKEGVQLWKLPVELEKSSNPAVSKAIRGAQDEDSNVRRVRREAAARAEKATSESGKAAIRADAETRAAVHEANAARMLLEAEKAAAGDEKLAIQMELGRRYSRDGKCELARKFYTLVADTTDQPHLRDEALRQAKDCSPVKKVPRSLLIAK